MISTSGPLGRYLSIAPPLAIWYRAAIASVVLVAYLMRSKKSKLIKSKKDRWIILGSSILMATHLVTYFFSLQLSNVAVAVLSLFTFPVFTALLEPLILNKKLDPIHIPVAAGLLFGLYFLIPNLDLSDNITLGAILGIFSAISYAFRNLLINTVEGSYDGIQMMAAQVVIMSIVLLPMAFVYKHEPIHHDWWALLLLGVFTTAVGHSLYIKSFSFFSITKVSILSGVQPVFGILMAFFLLNETPKFRTLIGGTIIIGLVIFESFRKEVK